MHLFWESGPKILILFIITAEKQVKHFDFTTRVLF